MSARILLPWPPGPHELYEKKRGGSKGLMTYQYATWRRTAGNTLEVQRPARFHEPVVITIELCLTGARRFDFADRRGVVIDLLVDHGIIPATTMGRDIRIERVSLGAPCAVTIATRREVLEAAL